MNEYERQLERARLARRQGMHEPSPAGSNSENRIEDVLRSREEGYVRVAPALERVPKVEPRPAVQERTSQETQVVEKKDSYRRTLKRIVYIVSVLILVPLVSLGGYRVFKNFEAPKDNASDVIKSVSKLASLPQGEEPTVATITDLTPLQGQEFFKDAHIGDKIIVYKQAGKAILYRPSQNKIITAAPLTH